ncbi:MAG: MFS transporter, partial [Myxococcaceae bacterium]
MIRTATALEATSHEQHRRVEHLILCALATFMAALDGSVVNVALPLVRADFHAPVSAMDWVVSAYLLSICALLLAAGKLGDAFGYVRLMALGFVVFGSASLFCGSAHGVQALSIARAVQGAGAAMLMASGPALIAAAFPPEHRGKALGAMATATYIGLALGPTLGGVISSALSWRWVFWINLPISVAGTALAARLFTKTARKKPQGRFDWVGAFLWAGLLVSALVAMERTESSLAMRLGLGAFAAVLLGLFIWQEGRVATPLLPLGLFRNKAFSGGVAAAWIQYAALFILNFMLPFFLEEARALGPAEAGFVMTAQPIVMMLTTGAAGWLADRVGPRIPSTVGLVVFALGMFTLAFMAPTGGQAFIVGGLMIVGLGVGLFTTPNNTVILSSAPGEHR